MNATRYQHALESPEEGEARRSNSKPKSFLDAAISEVKKASNLEAFLDNGLYDV